MSVKKNLRRGFKAVEQEEERREEARKEMQGKLWHVFFSDDDEEIPVTFLTEEPVCFFEHSLHQGGKYFTKTCGDSKCPLCQKGDKPTFKGAFLVIDHREFEIDERDKRGNKTGRKTTVSDRIKLLVRGQTDLAQLKRLHDKYGLTKYDYILSKTGKTTSTVWHFDRGDEVEYTDDEILDLLPEELREIAEAEDSLEEGLYKVVEYQRDSNLPSDSDNVDDEDEEEEDRKAQKGLRRVSDKSSFSHSHSVKSHKVHRDEEEEEEDSEEEEVTSKSKHTSLKPRSAKSTPSTSNVHTKPKHGIRRK